MFQPMSASLSSQSVGPMFSSAYTSLDRDGNTFVQLSTPAGLAETPAFKDIGPSSWMFESGPRLDFPSFSDPWAFDRVPSTDHLAEPTDHCFSFHSRCGSQDSKAYSPDNQDFFGGPEGSPVIGCSCHAHVMGHLVKSDTKPGMNGHSSIDGLLACQKELILQAEAILQCKLCSRSESQANMLMVVIIAIDGLLTVLDTSVAQPRPSCYDETTESEPALGVRQQKEFGAGFRSHVNACPLLVGGFPVPAEEKACFIRQVLQARLSMLLLAVRRIRVCMQQDFTAGLSRGRLLMIMETDRRLQLVMMKIKLAVN